MLDLNRFLASAAQPEGFNDEFKSINMSLIISSRYPYVINMSKTRIIYEWVITRFI